MGGRVSGWADRWNRHHQLHESGCGGDILGTLLWELTVAAACTAAQKETERTEGDSEAYFHISDS